MSKTTCYLFGKEACKIYNCWNDDKETVESLAKRINNTHCAIVRFDPEKDDAIDLLEAYDGWFDFAQIPLPLYEAVKSISLKSNFNLAKYNSMCAELLGFHKTCEDADFCFYTHSEGVPLGLDSNNSPLVRTMLEANHTNMFTQDWNCIMAVVEKIEKSFAWVKIEGCAVDISSIANTSTPNKKQSTVEAIWQFLNWYNSEDNANKK
jgi:hypothetical protein